MKEIIALISDDHAIVREGLRLILETFEDIAVARRRPGTGTVDSGLSSAPGGTSFSIASNYHPHIRKVLGTAHVSSHCLPVRSQRGIQCKHNDN